MARSGDLPQPPKKTAPERVTAIQEDRAGAAAVYNIGGNNLRYSGDFIGIGAQGSAAFGVGGQYSLTPEDLNYRNIFAPDKSYSIGFGPVCGYGLSGGASIVEYIPIVTINGDTGVTTPHAVDYMADGPDGKFDNGFVTRFVTELIPEYYQTIQNKVQEYGWGE